LMEADETTYCLAVCSIDYPLTDEILAYTSPVELTAAWTVSNGVFSDD